MRYKNYFLLSLMLLVLLVACNKNINPFTPLGLLYDIDKRTYYDDEIFNENYLDFYGEWQIDTIWGGWAGTYHEPNFDYLVIKKIGIYAFIRNNEILEYGKILIKEQAADELRVEFERADDSEFFFSESDLYVHIHNSNFMGLSSAAIDGYIYSFIRLDD